MFSRHWALRKQHLSTPFGIMRCKLVIVLAGRCAGGRYRKKAVPMGQLSPGLKWLGQCADQLSRDRVLPCCLF